ncbi:MAG: hypothetical protein DHS20C16_31180 [Phycisphaerae bacterium]|nr:MAG: hypothetical protein DHS20C16_31180 [Phycisphaerae bacterium]
MSNAIDIQKWLSNPSSVAVSIPAEAIFGVFKRSFDLPAGFAAKSVSRDDVHRMHRPGQVIEGSDLSELLIFRSQPIDLSFEMQKLPAGDNYLCDVSVQAQVTLVPERADLDSFRDRVIASRTDADVESVRSCLRPSIEKGMLAFVASQNSGELVGGKCGSAALDAVKESVAEVCFASGLTIDSIREVRFTSEGHARTRAAEEQAARRLHEHTAQGELREAISTAQNQKLDHLQTMLSKLKELADESPHAAMSDLMKAFSESQRGQLYQALFESRATQPVTADVVALTGNEVLQFDVKRLADPPKRIPVSGAAGRMRSVQFASSSSAATLWIGASNGIYELDIESGAIINTFVYRCAEAPRGGFNAVAVSDQWVVGTHSELGVIAWPRHQGGDAADSPNSNVTVLFEDKTSQAKAVRCATFAAGRFWCSVDDSILSVSEDDLKSNDVSLSAAGDTITALSVEGDDIFAGTVDGDVLHWAGLASESPHRIHAGSRRAVESIASITDGDVARLFYTDTSLAVYSQVLGDSFVCRYEAGGQTIRRAECASDMIVAINDARDRIVVWNANQPKHPAQTISIAQLTGHSTQDVCLIPLAHSDTESNALA